MESHEARHALDELSNAQTLIAEDLGHCPPWRHVLFGALFSVLIGSIAISSAAQLAAAPFILLATALIVRSDRKRLGVFINGYRRGATLPLTIIYLVAMIGLLLAAMYLRISGFRWAYKLGLSALTFAIAVGFSVYWQSIYRLELMAGVDRAKA